MAWRQMSMGSRAAWQHRDNSRARIGTTQLQGHADRAIVRHNAHRAAIARATNYRLNPVKIIFFVMHGTAGADNRN
jgi:hypothetical protein